ncbi:hypothetical protein ACIBCA_33810 [Kitasatospora sp. NPDC051170]|uniref:hypothetical protein n=1 Tax=Kitasatospora sp. NPDC051170 TaxID=3364056 RepID=UPI00379627FB
MPFEADLAHALDRTADSLDPDLAALTRGAVTRGRSLRRRRRAGLLAGAGACCAVIATAGLVLPGALSRSHDREPTPMAAPRTAISDAQMIRALEGTFPDGRFSQVKGQGENPNHPGDGAVANAGLILDDGHGPASVGVSGVRLRLPLQDGDGLSCDDAPKRAPGDTCRMSELPSSAELPGGALVMQEQNAAKGQAQTGVRRWTTTVTLKSTGAQLQMVQWNSTGGDGPAPTRTAPPLTDQEAVTALTGPSWAPILSALG